MIRMLFAMVATLAVFLAASLWWARDALLAPSADAGPSLAQQTAPSEPAPAPLAALPADPPASPASSTASGPAAVARSIEEPIEEEAIEEDAIEEERVVTPAAFQPEELPEAEREHAADASVVELPAAPLVSAHLDQDEWAHLIRRMLSLSRRTRAEAR